MLMPADLRQATRRLAATPLLSLGAIVILALGIGSAVVMADVLDRLLLRAPARVSDSDRVARLYVGFNNGRSYVDRIDYATFEAISAMRNMVDASTVFFSEPLTLGRGPDARRVESVAHSRDYFTVLGVEPVLGSWTEPSAIQRDDVAVISYGLWQREYGGAHDVLGRPLRLGLDTYTIIAVAPREFAGIGFKAADVWLPLESRAKAAYGPEWKGTAFFLQAAARLHADVNRDRVNEQATAAYRGTHTQPWEKSQIIVLGDLRPARAPGAQGGIRVEVLVAGMSIVVLLITCGNVANLLLVRGLRRAREFVVKTALGATRRRLLQEVLLEAALLAAGAGALSVPLVITGGTMMRREFLSPITALASPLDARLMLLTVVICITAAFLLGLIPAARLTTRRALTPGHAPDARPSRLLDLFSGLQVALSLPMIVAAGLFVVSLWNARHQDFGMQTQRVAVLTTNLFEVGRPWDNHAAHRAMQARIARLPQVESSALAQNVPSPSGWTTTSMMIDVPGSDRFKGPFNSSDLPGFNAVDPEFFAVMRMRLVTGRLFTNQENRKGAASVAVITESMGRNIWPGVSAVGKCFYVGGRGGDNPCTEVVGVIADPRLYPSIRRTTQGASGYYVPIEQRLDAGSARALLVRTVGDPANVLQALRRESAAAAVDLPYVHAYAFDEVFESMLKPWRLGSTVFVIFGALSVLIAGAGLAVVAAYSVTRRTREIGIRSALGAQPRHLVRLMLARSLLVVAAGLIGGMGLAWAGGRALNAQLFDVTAGDPRILAGAVCALLMMGSLAVWFPARRAARIDPIVALRTE
jgi:putative ABC transport system permease protein